MHTSVGLGGATRREWLLEGHPRSVGEARRHVLEVGERFVDETRLPDLELVISEVVSNAIRHSSDAGAVLLAVTPKDDYLCVQVTDDGPGFAPRPGALGSEEHGGFGLFIVEQLTRRWGMTREGGKTRVWFEMDYEPRPSASNGDGNCAA